MHLGHGGGLGFYGRNVENRTRPDRSWPVELQIGALSHREMDDRGCSSEILKYEQATDHLEFLLEHRMLGPTPKVSDSVGLAPEKGRLLHVSR